MDLGLSRPAHSPGHRVRSPARTPAMVLGLLAGVGVCAVVAFLVDHLVLIAAGVLGWFAWRSRTAIRAWWAASTQPPDAGNEATRPRMDIRRRPDNGPGGPPGGW